MYKQVYMYMYVTIKTSIQPPSKNYTYKQVYMYMYVTIYLFIHVHASSEH